jgi:hypothetical protein
LCARWQKLQARAKELEKAKQAFLSPVISYFSFRQMLLVWH